MIGKTSHSDAGSSISGQGSGGPSMTAVTLGGAACKAQLALLCVECGLVGKLKAIRLQAMVRLGVASSPESIHPSYEIDHRTKRCSSKVERIWARIETASMGFPFSRVRVTIDCHLSNDSKAGFLAESPYWRTKVERSDIRADTRSRLTCKSKIFLI